MDAISVARRRWTAAAQTFHQSAKAGATVHDLQASERAPNHCRGRSHDQFARVGLKRRDDVD
jgi:hypothetical protein